MPFIEDSNLNPNDGYKFGLICKDGWINVACTQADNEPLDIDQKYNGCFRDEEIPNDPAGIFITCCTADGLKINPIPSFEGEVCWDVEWEKRPNLIQKLRITYIGDNYYSVESIMGGQEEQHILALFGIAKIVEDKIIISSSESHSDYSKNPMEPDFSQCQYILNKSTLNGTGWCVGTFCNPPFDIEPKNCGIDYTKGTLTHRSCQ